MVALLRILLRNYLFWLVFFACHHIVFFIFNHRLYTQPFYQKLSTFYHSIPLDLSTASYAIALSWLFLLTYIFVQKKIWRTIIHFINVVLISIASMACLANTILYDYWREPIGKRAFDFLDDKKFILASVSSVQIIGGLVLLIVLTTVAIRFYFFVNKKGDVELKKYIIKTAFAFLSSFIIFYFMRGGLQTIPINESASYFSDDIQLNHAAINPCWYAGHNILQNSSLDENPFEYYESVYAKKKYDELFFQKSTAGFSLFKTPKPNIVLLLLESMTADVVGAFGAPVSYTPFLDSLCNYSLVYSDCYASGFRTDQALVSVFSGFPATPFQSIIRHDTKLNSLPSFPFKLNKLGYHTSFYYGGDVNFSNMKSYLTHMQFNKIYTQDDVVAPTTNKWGAHDEYTLNYLCQNLNKQSSPFFAGLLTISLHEPFDVPFGQPDTMSTSEQKFCNAAKYTDKCLQHFFATSALQPWFQNTVFILVADHGHNLPLNRHYFDIATHHIPLIFYGNALLDTLKGKRINKTVAQHDIAYSMLWQLDKKDSAFVFSNNICDTVSNGNAYVMYDVGFSYIENNSAVSYNKIDEKNMSWKSNKCDTSEMIMKGKIFQQELYTRFLKY